MIIKEGGQLKSFGKDEKIITINFSCDANNHIDLWIKSSIGSESLTYLSLEEAVQLKRDLQSAINELVNK